MNLQCESLILTANHNMVEYQSNHILIFVIIATETIISKQQFKRRIIKYWYLYALNSTFNLSVLCPPPILGTKSGTLAGFRVYSVKLYYIAMIQYIPTLFVCVIKYDWLLFNDVVILSSQLETYIWKCVCLCFLIFLLGFDIFHINLTSVSTQGPDRPVMEATCCICIFPLCVRFVREPSWWRKMMKQKFFKWPTCGQPIHYEHWKRSSLQGTLQSGQQYSGDHIYVGPAG